MSFRHHLIILACLGGFWGCAAAPPAFSGDAGRLAGEGLPRTWRSADGRFAVSYPDDWEPISSAGTAIVTVAPRDLRPGEVGCVLFTRERAPPMAAGASAAEEQRQGLLALRELVGPLSLIDTADATLGGRPARRWEFRHDEWAVRQVHTFARVGGEVWSADYAAAEAAFDRRRAAADAIVRSARFAAP